LRDTNRELREEKLWFKMGKRQRWWNERLLFCNDAARSPLSFPKLLQKNKATLMTVGNVP
jgi:hypothetical protein